jgi:flagellar hook-associated protein FlgK
MFDAVQIGLSGMKAAESAVSIRAQNIANLNTKGYRPIEPVQRSVPGGVATSVREVPLAPETAAMLNDLPAEGDNLVTDLVNLHLAEIAYKASASVVRTANEMSDVALEALG